MRIGIFLNSIDQPENWELYLLKKIQQTPNLQLTLLLTNTNKLKKTFPSFLLNWQISKETALTNIKIDLTEQETISRKEMEALPKLIIDPSEERLKMGTNIQKYKLDVLIDLTIGAINKEWAACSKFGLWYLHFGNLSIGQLAPLGYWETFLKLPLTEIYLLKQLSEQNSQYILNHGHYYRWETWSKNNSSLLDHVAGLVVKSLSEYHPSTTYQTLPSTSLQYKIPSFGQSLKYLFQFWKDYWKEQFNKKTNFNAQRWTLFVGKGQFLKADLSELIRIPLPKNEFWADPFFFEYKKELYIFFECYPSHTKKGVICCGKFKNNQLQQIETVLDLPYHLSYPFIFEEEGIIYMIPETCKNEQLEIYKCSSFPNKWELFSTGFLGESVVDTTYYKDINGNRWLFLNKAIRNNGHNTELHIFQIDSLKLNSIRPHAKNPVIIDARKARNGGAIFLDGDKVIRPSQNNSMGIYGYGLNLNQIIKLTLEEYEEKIVKQIFPDFQKNLTATHHLHQHQHHFIIDGIYNYQ